MGRVWLWLAVLTAVSTSQCVSVSTDECLQTICQFDGPVPEQCQNVTYVECNMKHRSDGQVNLTAKSFPENVHQISITNAKKMTIEADAISSLASMDSITLLHTDSVTFLRRSLARGNQSRPVTVSIQHVKSLEFQTEAFENFENPKSKVLVRNVGRSYLLPAAISSAQLSILSFSYVTTLRIDAGTFSAHSRIKTLWITAIKSLSISSGAFAPNVTVDSMIIDDVETLSLSPRAFARSSTLQTASMEAMATLKSATDGTDKGIHVLTINNVFMPICEEATFGSTIKSLQLKSSRINTTKAGCIDASNGWKSLHLNRDQFNHIKTNSFHGAIQNVRIEKSEFGGIAPSGLKMDVTEFSIEGSVIEVMSANALEVNATETIDFKECAIKYLKNNAFSSLDIDHAAKKRIRMEALKVKHPKIGSLQFAQEHAVLMLRLGLGVPCTCNTEYLARKLGLSCMVPTRNDCVRKRDHWLVQTRCENNGTWHTLGEYQLEFCPDWPGDLHDPSDSEQVLSHIPWIVVVHLLVLLIGAQFVYVVHLKRKTRAGTCQHNMGIEAIPQRKKQSQAKKCANVYSVLPTQVQVPDTDSSEPEPEHEGASSSEVPIHSQMPRRSASSGHIARGHLREDSEDRVSQPVGDFHLVPVRDLEPDEVQDFYRTSLF